jgi:uncharacterized protein (DUF58 family)
LAEVFDSRFLRRLEQLSLRVSKSFRSLGRGDRRSRRQGHSPEFREHKRYYPGDDIRQIDWLAYARLGDLFLKESSAEQDLVVHALLDCSGSMGVGAKFDFTRQVVAALLYIALCSGDRVRLNLFSSGQLGKDLGTLRGKRGFPKVLNFLREQEAAGETGLADVAKRFCQRGPPAGLVLVFSDLLDGAGYAEALKRLRYTKYEPLVVHIMSQEDMNPVLSGDHDLNCIETGQQLAMTLDRTALRLYREKVSAYLSQAQTFCRKHGIGYVLARDDESLEKLFFQGFRQAGFFQ